MPVLVLASFLGTPAAAADDRPAPPPAPAPQNLARVTVPAPAEPVAQALADVADSWLFRRAKAGLQVVDVATGEEVYEKGADELLLPASTMKVLTAAAALHELGPSYRFTTDVYHDGTLSPSGVLKGNLYVKGHGDPTFVVEKLWKLVGDLELSGIERIEGAVVFDDTFHADAPVLPGWYKEADIENGTPYFATLGALSLNGNTAVVVVGPGAEAGSKAEVALETPAAPYVEVDAQVTTGGPGTRRWIQVDREVTETSTRFVLTGSVPVDDAERTWIRRTVADPTAHFMAAFRAQMDAHGIGVTGKFREGTVPATAEHLLSVESPPLASVLMDMNKLSLNFHAEQVLRTLGAERAGDGTTNGGLGVLRSYLTSIGIPEADCVLVNGSGLTRDAKIKASVLTAVLVDMAHDPRVGAEFAASLAISGTDGTLWSRLRDDPGRLRGKTGTIDDVHCLAGYVDAEDGHRYAFAFLVNGIGGRVQAVRDVHDTFAREMFAVGAEAAQP